MNDDTYSTGSIEDEKAKAKVNSNFANAPPPITFNYRLRKQD